MREGSGMSLRDEVAAAIWDSCPYSATPEWPSWEQADPAVRNEFYANADAAIGVLVQHGFVLAAHDALDLN